MDILLCAEVLFHLCIYFTETPIYFGAPITGTRVPWYCETSRLPRFLDNRFADGGEVVSLTLQSAAPFAPGRSVVLISVRG
jgi:hypothetical protein